jgi:SOS-response transcriptional repressor LexA
MRRGFRDTLMRRLGELGWTYEELARRSGMTGVYISQIMQGKKVPKDDKIASLAEALGLELEELVLLAHYEKAPESVKPIFERLARHAPGEFLGEVKGFDNIELSALGHGRRVPVVGLVQAGSFRASEDGEYPPGVADDYVYTDVKGRNLFGVRVTGDSMEPEFREGDVLVVNPNLEAKNGDFVIAKLRDDNEVTFKKLVLHPKLIILRPLNSRYGDMVLTDPGKVEIVGRVVERKTLL